MTFQKARQASATRIAENIKGFVDAAPKGQKPDHNGAMYAAVIAEVTQLAAGQAVLESQISEVRQNMAQTKIAIEKLVEFIARAQQPQPPTETASVFPK